MKNLLGVISTAVPFLEAYPYWVKLLVGLWILMTAAILVVLLLLRPPKADRQSEAGKSITQTASTQGNVFQAGGDINITNTALSHPEKAVQSLSVEARLTCTLKEGAELPPSEVRFLPIGDSHAYLKGPAGNVRLDFRSPVQFRLLESNRIIVINRFTLQDNTDLINKPLTSFKNYDVLSVPIVTVVYGKSLERFTLLEVSFIVNGENIWYASWRYDVPFQVGPRFEAPLTLLHGKL